MSLGGAASWIGCSQQCAFVYAFAFHHLQIFHPMGHQLEQHRYFVEGKRGRLANGRTPTSLIAVAHIFLQVSAVQIRLLRRRHHHLESEQVWLLQPRKMAA
jgi:hypothetical protein